MKLRATLFVPLFACTVALVAQSRRPLDLAIHKRCNGDNGDKRRDHETGSQRRPAAGVVGISRS